MFYHFPDKGPQEKSRRMRTVFSPQQLDRLERYFKNQQYVGSAQRIFIASQLGLSETQVKVWFQNRRIRWRKTALNGQKKTLTEDQESLWNLWTLTKSILLTCTPGAFKRESPNSSNHTNINTLEVRGGARTGKRALHRRGAYYSNVLIPL